MFNIGATEFIIILVIALVVVGPERLPALARQAGTFVRMARQMYANLRAEMGPEFDDIERGVRDLRALNPREQVRNYSRALIDNVHDEVPEIKQIRSAPQLNIDQATRNILNDNVLDTPLNARPANARPDLNIDQAARSLLQDDVLDTPLAMRTSQSSNGHTPPSVPPSDDATPRTE